MAAAVALAFADASVVVLALPDLYRSFGVSIVDVSWVITSYNVAVVVAAVILLFVRTGPRRLTMLGLAIFALASVACGAAPSFAVLVAARCVQGAGAACLLVGSLPFLAALIGAAGRARAVWGFAGAIGVAIGPALGGVLTELFTWRSIFLVQAPVAVLALLGTRVAVGLRTDEHQAAGAGDGEASPDGDRVDWRAAVADLGYALLFAALVGALFLSVLLLIVVWAYSPLRSALVVSALAVGTVAVVPLSRRLPAWFAALAGGWTLTGGLLALAWLPAAGAGYALAALAFCGCGYGLLNSVLGRSSLAAHDSPALRGRSGTAPPVVRGRSGTAPPALRGRSGTAPPALRGRSGHGGLRRSGNLEVGAKHLGFVIGLVAIAPTLAGALTVATRDAALAATAVILDAPLELGVKVPLALDLKELVETTPRGEVPDVRAPFDQRAGQDEAVSMVRDDLTDAIEATITRSFRSSFLIAALFAAVATLVATGVGLIQSPTPSGSVLSEAGPPRPGAEWGPPRPGAEWGPPRPGAG